MKRTTLLTAALVWLVAFGASAQGFNADPVFTVELVPDRSPVVAGEVLQLAAVVMVEAGWHINSDDPGDEFSMPTTVGWKMPEDWPEPLTVFPDGEQLEFDFSDVPIEVWEGKSRLRGPADRPAMRPRERFGRESKSPRRPATTPSVCRRSRSKSVSTSRSSRPALHQK